MEWLSYKDGCDVCGDTHIEVFKRRADLCYRQTASGY